MSNKATTLAAALEKQGLPEPWHKKILAALSECGMLGEQMHATSSSQDALATMKAQATAQGLEMVRGMVRAGLARLQIEMPSPGAKLDSWRISAAAKREGWPTGRVLELKAMAARAGLLD
jgi:hypothetical protein